jgi:hypothetical protein
MHSPHVVLTRTAAAAIIKRAMSAESQRPLRPGDVVEVRPPAEILATVDENGALDSMPFMPEMLQYAGRRFIVSRRVDKICDTIAATGSRRMRDTVYLDDLRCDGSGHGGCQAGCRIYWKEAWLRRVPGHTDAINTSDKSAVALEQRAQRGARALRDGVESDSEEVWRCQATEAFRASERLRTSNLAQYWREFRSGNFRMFHFLRVLVRGFFWEVAGRVGLMGPVPLTNQAAQSAGAEPLDLQRGEVVQVRSQDEIAPTLDANGLNRGLSFDREMLPYCGGTYRVRDRVHRIIDDRSGRMLQISKDCIILEGVVCSGERSHGRWFCPREIYPYWREAWLRRVHEPRPDGRRALGADDSASERR